MKKPQITDLIFVCRKCNHNLYQGIEGNLLKKLLKLSETECPNCGEQGEELWLLSRGGNWKKEHGVC